MPSLPGKAGDLLPPGLRLLCVGGAEPSWVSLTLQLDALGGGEPRFFWAHSPSGALTVLREETFDCLLVRHDALRTNSGVDPLALPRAIRAGGCREPLILVAQSADDDMWAAALAIDVDLLVTPNGWESTALIPAIGRAITRGRQQANLERLAAAERTRRMRDFSESESLMSQQQQIADALLPTAARSLGELDADSPEEQRGAQLDSYYQELLRSYVMASSGSLSNDVQKLAEIFNSAGFTPRRILQLHLNHLGRLVDGLGSRSGRHVLDRANLLVLELLVRLGEIDRTDSGSAA